MEAGGTREGGRGRGGDTGVMLVVIRDRPLTRDETMPQIDSSLPCLLIVMLPCSSGSCDVGVGQSNKKSKSALCSRTLCLRTKKKNKKK